MKQKPVGEHLMGDDCVHECHCGHQVEIWQGPTLESHLHKFLVKGRIADSNSPEHDDSCRIQRGLREERRHDRLLILAQGCCSAYEGPTLPFDVDCDLLDDP